MLNHLSNFICEGGACLIASLSYFYQTSTVMCPLHSPVNSGYYAAAQGYQTDCCWYNEASGKLPRYNLWDRSHEAATTGIVVGNGDRLVFYPKPEIKILKTPDHVNRRVVAKRTRWKIIAPLVSNYGL